MDFNGMFGWQNIREWQWSSTVTGCQMEVASHQPLSRVGDGWNKQRNGNDFDSMTIGSVPVPRELSTPTSPTRLKASDQAKNLDGRFYNILYQTWKLNICIRIFWRMKIIFQLNGNAQAGENKKLFRTGCWCICFPIDLPKKIIISWCNAI